MTKYYILSDIHANLPALEAVMTDIKEKSGNPKRDPSVLVSLGDLVGYGPYPNEVIDNIRNAEGFDKILVYRGNHEVRLVKNDFSGISHDARKVLEWTREIISKANLEYLIKLVKSPTRPEQGNKKKILFTHADPTDYDSENYVIPTDRGNELVAAFFRDIFKRNIYHAFVGHSHIAQTYLLQEDRISYFEEEPNVPISFTGRSLVVVGSVGKPKNGLNSASWCEYDDVTGVVTHHRVPYDISRTQNAMMQINQKEGRNIFSEGLIKRLRLGILIF